MMMTQQQNGAEAKCGQLVHKIVVLQTQFGVLQGQLVAFIAVGVLGLECVNIHSESD